MQIYKQILVRRYFFQLKNTVSSPFGPPQIGLNRLFLALGAEPELNPNRTRTRTRTELIQNIFRYLV